MNVLVAVGTVRKLERALELRFRMASNATHFKVFANEGIFCLGMVEPELRLDLFPSLRRVAILTSFLLKSSMVRVHMTIGAVLKLHAPETDGLRQFRLVALFERHLNMQAGQGVARLGVIEILVSLGVLPVVYVVTVLTLGSKPSFVVVLMTGNAFGRRAEKRASGILPFQEAADLREHVRRRMALLTFDTGMFALQGITGQAMIELFFRGLPVNKREILAVMVQMAANALFAVGILHLKPRMVPAVFRKQTRDFLMTLETFERGCARTKLMAAVALRRATE